MQKLILLDLKTGIILNTSEQVKTLNDLRSMFLEVQRKNLGKCFPSRYVIRVKLDV